MFGKTTDKRVMREANRIVSLKDDMDAVSWERVLEISQLLQDNDVCEKCVALGTELADIAHSNLSLYSRFGIDPASSSHVMPSGIEVLEGGLAEAALEEQQAAKEREEPSDREDAGASRREISVPVHSEHLFSKTRSIESLRSERSWDELLGSIADEEASPVSQDGPEGLEPDEAAVEIEVETTTTSALCGQEPTVSAEEFPAEPTEPPALSREPAPSAAVALPEECEADVAVDARAFESAVSVSAEPVCETQPMGAEEPDASVSSDVSSEERPQRERFARFRSLYESRDGSLCVFEDEQGHLVAVDASKFA